MHPDSGCLLASIKPSPFLVIDFFSWPRSLKTRFELKNPTEQERAGTFFSKPLQKRTQHYLLDVVFFHKNDDDVDVDFDVCFVATLSVSTSATRTTYVLGQPSKSLMGNEEKRRKAFVVIEMLMAFSERSLARSRNKKNCVSKVHLDSLTLTTWATYVLSCHSFLSCTHQPSLG